MLDTRFGIEIEFTGISRWEAALVAKATLGGNIHGHKNFTVTDRRGRRWQFVYDGSIKRQYKINGEIREGGEELSVELVSPILTYRQDIFLLQDLVRHLRKRGAFTNDTCGIHVHIDGKGHYAGSLRYFMLLLADRKELLLSALHIPESRLKYCRPLEDSLIRRIKESNPTTLKDMEKLWYANYAENRDKKYHKSRYHLLNLHCFFHGNKTIELRGFNSTLHAGKVRAYIVFALALNHEALTARWRHCPYDRVYLSERSAMMAFTELLGMDKYEFENCRMHLCEYL